MAEFGDVVNEFKQAKPAEKTMIVLGIGAVIIIALYLHNKSTSAGGTPVGGTAAPSNAGGIQTVPTASGGSVPILPPGLTPIFDSMGNLLGYQPQPTQSTTVTTTAAGSNNYNPFTPLYGQAPKGFNTATLHQNIHGLPYTVVAGPLGRTWGVPGNETLAEAQQTPIGQAPGQKVLLYSGYQK